MSTISTMFGDVTHSYKWGKRQVRSQWGKSYKSEDDAIKGIEEIKQFITSNQKSDEMLDCNFIYTLYQKDGEVQIPISKRMVNLLKKQHYIM